MPIVEITVVEGRDEAKVQQCIKEVAQVVNRTLEAPMQSIRVWVNEVPPGRFAVGDQLKSEKK
ncbi:tautomerase family protein [Alkalilimnicola sp. S0819]|uniref:tautomerase family protein n=1 Tax=Alkalilimnicola sp. S0819 TaxID=2613922 RepID=UPI001261D33E|nr:tautomerase family protein [Alkalilimnicola sp. S0819]KAB7623680.1 4-oxalocrotonate tautomerase [Alkalilimnicola sp. S0819]MPQ16807.1 4-oxalocrotonate tautomerase [Alkalilimnicola sp. S0819]